MRKAKPSIGEFYVDAKGETVWEVLEVNDGDPSLYLREFCREKDGQFTVPLAPNWRVDAFFTRKGAKAVTRQEVEQIIPNLDELQRQAVATEREHGREFVESLSDNAVLDLVKGKGLVDAVLGMATTEQLQAEIKRRA